MRPQQFLPTSSQAPEIILLISRVAPPPTSVQHMEPLRMLPVDGHSWDSNPESSPSHKVLGKRTVIVSTPCHLLGSWVFTRGATQTSLQWCTKHLSSFFFPLVCSKSIRTYVFYIMLLPENCLLEEMKRLPPCRYLEKDVRQFFFSGAVINV